MILVDTSIWADFLGRGDEMMATLLDQSQVVTHPFVIGEIALGCLPDREAVLADLSRLPTVVVLDDRDVVAAIEYRTLFGTGVGYVDVHLALSALATPDATLWTRDKKLLAVAERLGIAAKVTN